MKESDFRLDRTAFSVMTLGEADEEDKRYWLARTPAERLAAVELMRQINYDYDPDTDRIQRVLEFVERERR